MKKVRCSYEKSIAMEKLALEYNNLYTTYTLPCVKNTTTP